MRIAVPSRAAHLYSTARLRQAAEARGHECVVIDHTRCWMDMQKSHPAVYYGGERLAGIDAIIPRIGASVTFYGAAVVRQFEMMNVFTTLRSIALVRSRDKLRSLQLLAREGVDVPRTAFARGGEDISSILDRVNGPPVVLKLLEGTQGKGVVLAESANAARSVIDAFHGLKADFLVQEYIEEARGADIRAFVVGGKIVGAMRRQGAEGEFRSNLHQGGTGVSVQLGAAQRRTALKAARALGLHVAGVDIIQSDRGPLVLEVNSSPGLEGIESVTQRDVASSIIEWIENKSTKRRSRDVVGA